MSSLLRIRLIRIIISFEIMDTIELSITSSNYNKDKEIVRLALREVATLTHSYEDFEISEPESTFGWYFFTVTINKNLIIRLANLEGNELLKYKGKTLEKKFVGWLEMKMKKVGCNAHMMLKEEFMSSKYGLF